MAQSAVTAIRSGCQMLSEGRADIENFKKGTEQAVADAKAIYKEVKGIWSWIKGLLGIKETNNTDYASTRKRTSVGYFCLTCLGKSSAR